MKSRVRHNAQKGNGRVEVQALKNSMKPGRDTIIHIYDIYLTYHEFYGIMNRVGQG